MEKITSIKNKQIKFYKNLNNKKNRKKFNLFIVEGIHLVEMAKQAFALEHVLLSEDINFEFEKKTIVNYQVIKHLSSTITPQNIIGVVKMVEHEINYDHNFIILEDIQNPGNLGAILRNALAFGFKNIILSPKSVDLYNPKVTRASQGAIFLLNVFIMPLNTFFENFKGIKIGTSLQDDAKPLLETKIPSQKYCIIFGNEASGISQQTLKSIDLKIKIKIKEIDSLNVAVSNGIILQHFQKK